MNPLHLLKIEWSKYSPSGTFRVLTALYAGSFALVTFLAGASFGLPDFAMIALLAVLIAGLGMSSGFTAQLFSWTPIIWLGEISYSLYMVHFPVLRTLRIFLTPTRMAAPVACGLSIIICIACASVLYYAVERPIRSRLRNSIGEMPKRFEAVQSFK